MDVRESVNDLVDIRAKVKGILLRLEVCKYMMTRFIQITSKKCEGHS